MLLSIAYFPPVSWFAAALRDLTLSPDGVFPSVVDLEACEHYVKQSWRNRCRIAAAGGVESLGVPVLHGEGLWTRPITEVRVDYSTPWVIRTERALAAAYESAPFFDHYAGGIFSLLESGIPTLWDLDLALIRHILAALGLAVTFRPTTAFVPPAGAPDDLRYGIHPKRPNAVLASLGLEKPYYQVFALKYGFQADLSILDLLFCEGPEASAYLLSR